jgi:hypothetical protein
VSARFILTAVGLALATAACEPSPEDIAFTSKTDPLRGDGTAALVEGDVMVVGAEPLDDDHDPMDLCIRASSSAPAVLTVERVRGKCRLFVLSGKSPGRATVSFSARDGNSTLVIDVTAPP